ncbi:EAL domain-containing protein [Sphingomicrobium lutaoense]|uniref:EAL domain-containing protein (Putative c-di-GMP-specific phosphodiesterase class I) n=1 Tax=Sphingomicrobium lutaoense TaxID=515949 RepID=A0A839Z4A9_9SPHN|nr:EAL domain-containing protein [Sphingomicrobium lutaoense]MBB3763464.1 EAL domain-containing protein (putative c-di-GMP-specific phosphodiesterase class I) [Sphingomicrobium lutaoense]
MTAPPDLKLLDGFERALINERLHYAYQPKISLATGKLKRVEALVRWHDPEMGAVPPSRFIPLAEGHGLIDQLTRYGLDRCFTQWKEWRAKGIECELAFNISAMNLNALDFPDIVEAKCEEHGVPAECLVLELTEGSTQSLVNLMDTLTRFRIKGIGLAIDDFGTGYSTMKLVRQLPFTEVKIDRFFISDATRSMDSRVIVEAMIGLAHGLGLSATCEGVETREQIQLLRAMECDVAQGYGVSKPLLAEDLPGWIEQWEAGWDEMIAP